MKTVFFFAPLIAAQLAFADLTVLTDRPQDRFQNAARLFTAQTGENVVLKELAYKDILKELASQNPADVVITKDLIYLSELSAKKLLQPMRDSKAVQKVPAPLRDPDLNWTALTFRVRTAVYNPAHVRPEELTTYADLASSKWQGRLCLRTGRAAYNEALVGHLILQQGLEGARATLQGWVNNLATDVLPSDIPVLEALADGTCDVGIVNHYYLAGVLAKNPQFPVKIAFLNQHEEPGLHANGAGIGIAARSSKALLAQSFIDILLSDAIQLEISSAHFDYPAVQGLAPNTFIRDWGTFQISPLPWSLIGEQAPRARQLMQEVGYN